MIKIHAVTKYNRSCYEAALESTFRHRYKIFVEHFGWDIPNDGEREQDQFDTDDAIYLLALNAEEKVRAFWRLIPTLKPHILSEIYPDLCAGPVPRDQHRYEMSRFYCLDKLVRGEAGQLSTAGAMVIGLHEYCLATGISHLSNITEMQQMATMITGGFDMTPLGIPKQDGKQWILASTCNMTETALSAVRARHEFNNPTVMAA